MKEQALDAQAPLTGYVVVDASTHLAGPFAGLMLADLGATVIKVEPPTGDPLRSYTGPGDTVGQLAASINRNKRSVSVDLKQPEGRESFLALLSTADVLLHNWRTATEESLDLDDDALSSRNPRLVRVAVTGFGPSGPRAAEPAFDQIIQAMTGLAVRQGHPDEPEIVRTYLADKTSSMFAVQAVLAALLRRADTNLGVRVDVPMLDATAYYNFPDMYEGRIYLDEHADLDSAIESRAFVRTADGHLVIAPGSGRQIKRTLEIAGHPEWKEELMGIRDRTAMMGRLLEMLEPVLARKCTDFWLERFSESGVPCAKVLDLDEHLFEPQVLHNGTYTSHEHPEHGRVLSAQYPARFRGLDRVPPAPFPRVGDNSSSSELADLSISSNGTDR